MVRLKFSIELNYNIADPGGDFIFSIHAAKTAQQIVLEETLSLSQPVPYSFYTDPVTHTRFMCTRANAGQLSVRYAATADLYHHSVATNQLSEVAVLQLPGAVLPYLYPSRYCQSDRLIRFATKEFGHLPTGYSRAQAICDWVTNRVTFQSNSSNSTTTAIDTLIEEVGVCRDFAHLMVALCRAVNLPARFATGIDFGAPPELGPTDFHAYVEVYLGNRWYLFDPSGVAIPMGFLRFGTGRDAADTAFATIFGNVQGAAPVIQIEVLPNALGLLVMPQRVNLALSTDEPMAMPT